MTTTVTKRPILMSQPQPLSWVIRTNGTAAAGTRTIITRFRRRLAPAMYALTMSSSSARRPTKATTACPRPKSTSRLRVLANANASVYCAYASRSSQRRRANPAINPRSWTADCHAKTRARTLAMRRAREGAISTTATVAIDEPAGHGRPVRRKTPPCKSRMPAGEGGSLEAWGICVRCITRC